MLSSAQHFSLFIWVLERHWNMTESSQSEIMCFSSKILCVQIKLGCAKRKRCDFFSFLISMCVWEVGLCFVFWRLLRNKDPSLEVCHINLTEHECKVFLVTIYIPPREATSDCVTILLSIAVVNNFEKYDSEQLWVWGLAMTGRKKKSHFLSVQRVCY